MIGSRRGDPISASNFFSSEAHDKSDPFQVGRSRAALGEFGQVTPVWNHWYLMMISFASNMGIS